MNIENFILLTGINCLLVLQAGHILSTATPLFKTYINHQFSVQTMV